MHLHGQAGTLDNNFGGDGIVTTEIGGEAHGNAIVVQTNGRIVVAGSGTSGTSEFAAVRYLPDGTLDGTFSADGISTLGLTGFDEANALVVQPDGKILMAGYITLSSSQEMAVMRLDATGLPDPGFGLNGIVFTSFDGLIPTHAYGNDMALQPDGRILVCGTTGAGNAGDIAVARFEQNGTLDDSFSFDGKVILDINGYSDESHAIAIQPDGKILVAGATSIDGQRDAVVVRLLENGSTDPSFGNNGALTLSISTTLDDIVQAIAVQPDSRIILAGNSGPDGMAVRLLSIGSLDASFNGSGIFVNTLLFATNSEQDVRLQPDGKILLGGSLQFSGEQSTMGLLRLLSTGQIDASFGNSGGVQLDISNGHDHLGSVALQSDNRIMVCGSGYGDGSMIVARLLNDVGIGIPEADPSLHECRLFPNPATDQVQLHYALTSSSNVTCLIRESSGRVMHTPLNQAARPAGTHTLTMNLEGLSAGAYVVELRSEHGISHHSLIRR